MSFHDLLDRLNPWWKISGARPAVERARRDVFGALLERLDAPDVGRAQVLLGPRRVGKSTLLRQLAATFLERGWHAPNLTYFDFKDERSEGARSLTEVLQEVPGGFDDEHPRLLLFDEVTRAPDWDLSLKRLVDETRASEPARRARILVTDSAASLMRTGAKETLEGRIDELTIHPLSFREALRFLGEPDETERETFRRIPGVLERYLSSGGMPEHIAYRDLELAWERIRSDIADKAIARDLARDGVDVERATALYRFLVETSGGLFDAANRASDLTTRDQPTDARTIRRWVELLEHACLLGRLGPWHPGLRSRPGKPSRALKARPKLYAEDHGAIAAFSASPGPMSNSEVRGRIFETVVFNHLRDLRDRRKDYRLGFFREGEELELDFVLDFGDVTLGIEVTSSPTAEKKLAALRRLPERVRPDHLTAIHGGNRMIQDAAQASAWPLDGFLLDPEDCIERGLGWARKSP